MSNSLYRLPSITAAAAISLVAVFWASAKSDWDQKATERKADYIFLEAQSAYNSAQYDKYITLLERAYALDSADIDISGEWGILTLLDESTDSAKAEKGYALIRRQFLSNPSNYISGVVFSNAAQRFGKYGDAVMVWETLDSIYPTRPEVALELAEAYTGAYANGDTSAFHKAIAIYDRIEQGSGRSVQLTSKKLYPYYIKEDTLAIEAELDSLYTFAPHDSYVALFIGANYQYINKPDEAIKYYDIACSLDSTNGSAYLSRARFYNEQGDSAAFDREVFQALQSQNLDVDSKLGILRSYVSELYTDTTQQPRLRQLFDTLELMHPGEPQIHSLYGSYLYELSDYQGACEQFSYAVALDPADRRSWNSYIQTAALANDSTTIYKDAPEAISRFPDDLYFPVVLSMMYNINDQKYKAIAVLDSVDVSDVRNPNAVSNFLTTKGDLYASVGDTIKAIEIYDTAIDLNPDNSMALNNAAYFMALLERDLDKAERYSARSLEGDELNPTFLDTYAWVFFKKKDYKMAKYYIDIALNSYSELMTTDDSPENTEEGVTVLPQNVVELADSTDVEEMNLIEEEVQTSGPSADIYDHAGDIYFMNGEKDQALVYWEKALNIDPDDTTIQQKVKYKTIFFR